MKKRTVATVVLCLTMLSTLHAAPKATQSDGVFYVYHDKSDRQNHYAASGWMGDYGDLKLDDAWKENPEDGLTAMKWTYNGKGSQGANWAGVYWQHPANNWGDKPGGFDLSAYKRLTFWARGEKGGEVLTEVKIGGITGQFADSDDASIGPVVLTKEWKKYTIDLAGKNLAKIVGGFCWVTNLDVNPTIRGKNIPMVIYLDEIRFEK